MIIIIPQSLEAGKDSSVIITCQAIESRSQEIIGFYCEVHEDADINQSIRDNAVVEFARKGITADQSDKAVLLTDVK